MSLLQTLQNAKAATHMLSRLTLTQRNALRTFKLTRIKRAIPVQEPFPPEADACAPRLIPPKVDPQIMESFELHVDGCMAYRVFDDFEEDEITPLPQYALIQEAFQYPHAPNNTGWYLEEETEEAD